MYNGVIKAEPQKPKKFQTTFLMLQQEATIVNGINTTKLILKEKTYKKEENESWKDYQIANLQATGIEPTEIVQLQPSNETIMNQAGQANLVLEYLQTLNKNQEDEKSN